MYLGIDIGTSSVKAVLVDDGGSLVGQASDGLVVSRPQPGFSEQDSESWWLATVNAVTALPKELRAAVRAVGLSGQMHGATLLDDQDRPLRHAILWNDGRSALECVELRAELSGLVGERRDQRAAARRERIFECVEPGPQRFADAVAVNGDGGDRLAGDHRKFFVQLKGLIVDLGH